MPLRRVIPDSTELWRPDRAVPSWPGSTLGHGAGGSATPCEENMGERGRATARLGEISRILTARHHLSSTDLVGMRGPLPARQKRTFATRIKATNFLPASS